MTSSGTSTATVLPKKRRGIFYGWWIVLGGALAMTMGSLTYNFGISAFFLPIANDFGTSRTALSGAFSVARLENGIMGPIQGWLVDRFGPRPLMIIGNTIFGLGFILLARVHSLTMFYLVFIGLMAFGNSIGLGTALSATVSNWFVRKRGRAAGIFLSGNGVGAALVPVVALIVVTFGWQGAAIIMGFFIFSVGIPISFLMRRRPEDYGMYPDGEPPDEQGQTGKSARAMPPEADFTLREAMGTRSFWLIGFFFNARLVALGVIGVHFIPHLEDIGYSQAAAAGFLGLVGLVGIGARLGSGFVADVVSKRLLLCILTLLIALSMVVLAVAHDTWQIVLFSVLYGFADGGNVPVYLAIRGDYFGRRHFATISGTLSSIGLLGTIIGPVIAGLVYDFFGSYTIAFLASASIAVVAGVFIFTAKRPPPPKRLAGQVSLA